VALKEGATGKEGLLPPRALGKSVCTCAHMCMFVFRGEVITERSISMQKS